MNGFMAKARTSLFIGRWVIIELWEQHYLCEIGKATCRLIFYEHGCLGLSGNVVRMESARLDDTTKSERTRRVAESVRERSKVR